MALIKIDWNPSVKHLRDFGKIAVVAMACLAALLYFVKGISLAAAVTIFAAGIIIFAVSLISKRLTRFIYLALTLAGYPIGLAVNFIVMAVFFFIVITPISIFFKIIGRDPLSRKFDRQGKSYWLRREEEDSVERYFRQF